MQPLGRRIALALLAISIGALVAAQEREQSAGARRAELRFTGEPLRVPLECREEHLLGAGLVCNQVAPCELRLELVSVTAAAGGVLVAGEIHADAGTVSSLLLVSADGGTVWREAAERAASSTLETFYFADPKHGWLAGLRWDLDASTIPFFLVTTNGGRSWRKHEVWEPGEDKAGEIVEFAFDSPRHGFLIIRRAGSAGEPFELYETMTGGASWSIREISAARPRIPLRRLPPAESEWRLREDRSRGGTYWIETRRDDTGEDEAWEAVAAFSSSVGVCNTMERPEPGETKPGEIAPVPRKPGGVFRLD